MNDSWGFRITDRKYKSFNEIIRTLVGAAGRNSNLLLNVGPMPNGEIQEEFVDTLQKVGQWVKQYGNTIYGTRGGPMTPENWGVTTQNEENVYLHLLGDPGVNVVFIPGSYQISKIKGMNLSNKITVTPNGKGIIVDVKGINFSTIDNIILLPKAK
jgi:alpha-L-fucosidase